ncbi:MAG: hypothetical protein CR972_00280 [Candidatus Moraniibacteriota bacterium]|nr:MAG: hypothetical protein CR972_00280 [Candidatus Moranbacteria bacterium]
MEKKSLKTQIVEKVLRWASITVLWRQNPIIIGVTGSVGKTTTKDMIAHVLKKRKTIWATQKNYNNEIGVPLTVLCIEKNISSLGGLLYICGKWFWAMCTVNYPEILVVEMGVDRPGDMDYLTSIVQPDISVITAVSHAHSEFFPSVMDIANEKQKIVTNMKKTGTAIINADDRYVESVKKKTDVKIVSYGTKDGVNFCASDIEVCFRKHDLTGLSFKLNYKGKVMPVRLKNVIAEHLIYAALAALAVADNLQVNVVEAARDITDFISSPGRMRLLDGKNDVLIIDDTYNASPKAMDAAIKTLQSASAFRKIAVLGDMLELGEISKNAHEKVANQLAKTDVHIVFFVGREMEHAYKKLKKNKSIETYHFTSASDAVDVVMKKLVQGDVVLCKGSRGMKMEQIVKEIAIDHSQTL